MPVSKLAVSESTMKSAAIMPRYFARKRLRFSEPISSSPSITNFTLHGSVPPDFRYEATAATCSHDAALVVGGAAAVEAAVAFGGFVRRRQPLLGTAGRLDVVMSVEEERRLAGGMQPVAIYIRMGVGDLEDVHVLDADVAQRPGDAFRRTLHLGRREAFRRHARDAAQLDERALEVFVVRPRVAKRLSDVTVRLRLRHPSSSFANSYSNSNIRQ